MQIERALSIWPGNYCRCCELWGMSGTTPAKDANKQGSNIPAPLSTLKCRFGEPVFQRYTRSREFSPWWKKFTMYAMFGQMYRERLATDCHCCTTFFVTPSEGMGIIITLRRLRRRDWFICERELLWETTGEELRKKIMMQLACKPLRILGKDPLCPLAGIKWHFCRWNQVRGVGKQKYVRIDEWLSSHSFVY